MKQVFADTLYWVASITPGDPWHAPTLRAVAALEPVHLVTTEEVLVEFLSAYAGRGAYLRGKALQTVRAEAVVQVETTYDPSSVSAMLMKFVVEYVVSQGISQSEADAWAGDLRALGSGGDYFFSLNEYIFTAAKP